MPATKALTFYLGELDQPVITDYQLGTFLFKLYRDRNYGETYVRSPAKSLNLDIYKRNIKNSCAAGILTKFHGFPQGRVFTITGKKGFEPGDIACAIDPFAYVSHLSAMAYHGFTDRIPSSLFISRPKSAEWKDFASSKMEKDLGEYIGVYLSESLPKLVRLAIRSIGRTPVHSHSSIHLGAFKNVRGRSIRVSTVGRTFLDMVREPMLCGGMRHVVAVFREHGKKNKTLIIDEANRYGNQIEKARIGYLLEEMANVKDKSIDDWARHVQRGGSRKLDPSNEYEPAYSERWCISLNVPAIEGD